MLKIQSTFVCFDNDGAVTVKYIFIFLQYIYKISNLAKKKRFKTYTFIFKITSIVYSGCNTNICSWLNNFKTRLCDLFVVVVHKYILIN